MRKFLLGLCGLPSSGKTALAKAIKSAAGPSFNIEIVSTDTWRDAEYYANFSPDLEHQVRELALSKTKEILESGSSVIHDDTNYYASMRHELYELAKVTNSNYFMVYVSTPTSVALKWNEERGGNIPSDVIKRIGERFDDPGSKYRWDRTLARIDPSNTDIHKEAAHLIEEISSFRKRPRRVQSDRNKRLESLDLLTRRVVRDFLRKHQHMRNRKEVLEARKDVLKIAAKDGLSKEETKSFLLSALKRLL